MITAFFNSFKIPELRDRILFTLGLVFICRIVTAVPSPGIDAAALQMVMDDIKRQAGAGGNFLSWIDLFSGGALSQCAVGALSIWPYISASIILQMMTAIIPALERMVREGEAGRQKFNQYTRYLTLGICVVQGIFLAVSLEHPEALGFTRPVVLRPGPGFWLLTALTMTTGTMLLMWLGEQITDRGIGNGISIVITVNIISRLPGALGAGWNMLRRMGQAGGISFFHVVLLIVLMFVVIAGVIALTQAQRKIPIHTAKRVVGRKIYGGQSTYMPLRVNYSGVMPIIFASAMIQFPAALLGRIPLPFFKTVAAALRMDQPLYLALYGLLILFFSYFWVATQFNPLQIADDLKRNGGYVPGIRPGRPTAEFLDKTMTRITLIGAIGLTIIAVIPSVMQRQFNVPWLVASFFGGTSLLIIVGVALDTMRQVEAHLLMRHYDGFLRKGRLHGRR